MLDVQGIRLGMMHEQVVAAMDGHGYSLTDARQTEASFVRSPEGGAIKSNVKALYQGNDGKGPVQEGRADFFIDAAHLDEREAFIRDLKAMFGEPDQCKSYYGTLTGRDLLSATCWWSRQVDGRTQKLTVKSKILVSMQLAYQ